MPFFEHNAFPYIIDADSNLSSLHVAVALGREEDVGKLLDRLDQKTIDLQVTRNPLHSFASGDRVGIS